MVGHGGVTVMPRQCPGGTRQPSTCMEGGHRWGTSALAGSLSAFRLLQERLR